MGNLLINFMIIYIDFRIYEYLCNLLIFLIDLVYMDVYILYELLTINCIGDDGKMKKKGLSFVMLLMLVVNTVSFNGICAEKNEIVRGYSSEKFASDIGHYLRLEPSYSEEYIVSYKIDRERSNENIFVVKFKNVGTKEIYLSPNLKIANASSSFISYLEMNEYSYDEGNILLDPGCSTPLLDVGKEVIAYYKNYNKTFVQPEFVYTEIASKNVFRYTIAMIDPKVGAYVGIVPIDEELENRDICAFGGNVPEPVPEESKEYEDLTDENLEPLDISELLKSSNSEIIELNKEKLNLVLSKRNKSTYKFKIATNIAKKEIRWRSSNKKIATISKNGKITAKRKGSVIVQSYAYSGKSKIVSKKCKVTIKK